MGVLGQGGVFRIYKSLIINSLTSLDHLRTRWEGWLGPMEADDWRDASWPPSDHYISQVETYSTLLPPLCIPHPCQITPCRLSAVPSCPRCAGEPTDLSYDLVLFHRSKLLGSSGGGAEQNIGVGGAL